MIGEIMCQRAEVRVKQRPFAMKCVCLLHVSRKLQWLDFAQSKVEHNFNLNGLSVHPLVELFVTP